MGMVCGLILQWIVVPVSNKDTVWLLLTLTGKLVAYLL